MSAYLIAMHKFRAGTKEYRTHYYREMLDARARFGAKNEAHRFTAPGADVTAEQLRTLMPRLTFHVIEEGERPPRPAPDAWREHLPPHQVEFIESPPCSTSPNGPATPEAKSP